jgi:hypothetical protein
MLINADLLGKGVKDGRSPTAVGRRHWVARDLSAGDDTTTATLRMHYTPRFHTVQYLRMTWTLVLSQWIAEQFAVVAQRSSLTASLSTVVESVGM